MIDYCMYNTYYFKYQVKPHSAIIHHIQKSCKNRFLILSENSDKNISEEEEARKEFNDEKVE